MADVRGASPHDTKNMCAHDRVCTECVRTQAEAEGWAGRAEEMLYAEARLRKVAEVGP